MEKAKTTEGLLKEQNQEFLHKNFELSQENRELKRELQELAKTVKKLNEEKVESEKERLGEQKRWEDTTELLKSVINDLDHEKKLMEGEIQKLGLVAERCKRSEFMVVELKYSVQKINEDRHIEKEAAKEQIESILKELSEVRREKEEILSEKIILDAEIGKYKRKIVQLEEKVKLLNRSRNQKAEIFNWCAERRNRRDLISSKQNRVYGPQSTKSFKDMVKPS